MLLKVLGESLNPKPLNHSEFGLDGLGLGLRAESERFGFPIVRKA